jgi:hypothetical protein
MRFNDIITKKLLEKEIKLFVVLILHGPLWKKHKLLNQYCLEIYLIWKKPIQMK